MSLKFKKAVAEWEKVKKEAEERIQSDTGHKVVVDLDMDAIKAVGNSETTRWTNDTQIPRDEATVLWFTQEWFHYWYVLAEGYQWWSRWTEVGKEIFAKSCDKIIFSVQPVSGANHYGDAKCHHLSMQNNVWTYKVDVDYTQYIGQQPSTSVRDVLKQEVRKILDEKGFQYHFLHRKIDCEKKRQEMQDRLNGSTKTPIEIVVDYDNIQKISNPTVISNDIKEPGCCGVLVAFEGNAFLGVVIAIEDLCRDDMTKEAISEQIKKIVLHAEPGASGINMSDLKSHKVEKKGNELHITMRYDFDSYVNQSFPNYDLKNLLEGML